MSAREIAEGSTSRLDEENKSEEKMAQDSILRQLIDRISSPPISELLGKLKLDQGFLNTLKKNLLSLDVILDDAESKAYGDIVIRKWLDELKAVGYDLEDLLAEIAAERLRHQLESKTLNIETWLHIPSQLEQISRRTTRLLQEGKQNFGLREASRMLREPYPLSAAKARIEDVCLVCGRDEDKNAIIELLLSDNETDDPVTVIPIVGVDGVGKSTLARFVYNDYRVTKHFDLKGWVSASDNRASAFGPLGILTESIFKAFSTEDTSNYKVELREILNMKKFLLILDDESNELHRFWDELLHCFEGAKGGGKILLTTWCRIPRDRPKWILPEYDLKPLNSDGSWMLFVKHAFADIEVGSHPTLEAIGKCILEKCNGLPLPIATLGAMLRFKPSVEEWEAVSRKLSDLDTSKEMSATLRMSYESLPPNLKRCFAYCSIFSSNHEYDKEKLVLLWMAEGFLQHSKHRRIEEVGHEYFDDLTSRSFFQKSGANSSRFVMHSCLHKLARSESGEFCFKLDSSGRARQGNRLRHFSLSGNSYPWCSLSENTSRLRTFLLSCLPRRKGFILRGGYYVAKAMNWQFLRVLSFSYATIIEFPKSVGALKLLQYLDLSHTNITRLPNVVTTLYNLQTLLLSYCHLLSKLPKEFSRLVCLRHLDVRETGLEEMPVKMGCLTSLQSLSDFVVGGYRGSNISELESLSNLRGTLRISQLQNVTSARDASQANMKDKADIQVLELEWTDATENSQHATNVLEKLEPHQNLEKLSILSYNGISFPDWVADSSFSKMVFLRLSDCNSCSHLPPLGQLPSLKELIIEGMNGVKKIGKEFFGVNNVAANPFPSLEILVFQKMPEWEGWIASEMQPLEFPRLKQMCIKDCPKYEKHSSLCLPLSAKVEEFRLPDVLQRTDVSITSIRSTPGSHKHLTEDEKTKNVSTVEIVKGSMSLIAEENTSEEKMAQDSIFRQLLDWISSPPISELLGKLKLYEGFLNTLKTNLLCLDAILYDAESKAYEKKQVKKWLDDLKEVGYDLEDLLDEIVTERLRHQLESKTSNIETWLQMNIVPSIPRQLDEISSRITLLLQRGKEGLGLREASRMLREPYPLSAAKARIEDVSLVCGRDEDKNAIIELLLSDNETDDPVTVIPIVGVDGVGKSTLARFVYNDYRVTKHFDLKGWVSASDHWASAFDPLGILTESIFKAFSTEDTSNYEVELREIPNMKKFLLILDDESNELHRFWDKLLHCFEGAKGGGKILLTTRCRIPRDRPKWILPEYDLKPLNSDGSWMLFVKHAFADIEVGSHPTLEAIGKCILEKCNGLPLPIATLGAMLRFKPSVEEWEAVSRKLSDLDTSKEMSATLRMSYESLPPNLKRCFAYCSIFSSNHEYDKEKLVLLWMAEGFLQHSKHRRIEEVGHEYFDDLTSRSFFQKSGANSSRFVMHSRLHELARSESGEFCFKHDSSRPYDRPPERVRHLSVNGASYELVDSANGSKLRTLLSGHLSPWMQLTRRVGWNAENWKMDEDWKMAENWQYLRVRSFSPGTITLPNLIGALKLLRYLDLSHTKITRLPSVVTTLYNLQTLLLSYCHLLSKLPKKFRKLVYLRHLDIRKTPLKEMPAKLGCLTSLQSLSDFAVGDCSGSNISELGSLSNLRGTLCISQLQNVTSGGDASKANLKNKADLQVLELEWTGTAAYSQHATDVLEKLEPHQNLEKLSILSYNGICFPDWVGDSSFSKMVFLRLSDCNSCSHLPPLGQLPSLKELIIEGMSGVKKIGKEFFGVNNVAANPFPSLEILVIREMPEWEGWIVSEVQTVEFTRLQQMCTIINCPKYKHNLTLCESSVSEETSVLPTEETLPEQPFTDEKQSNEGNKVKGKEKLQDGPDSNVVQRTDVSTTSYSSRPASPKSSTEDSSSSPPASPKSSTEDSSATDEGEIAATEIPSDTETDELIKDEGDELQFRRNEELLDRASTSRRPEDLRIPDSNVVQRTDVPFTSNSPPQESPRCSTEDSSAHNGGASKNSAAIETLSDPTDSEDSQEDISSPEQESMNVSQLEDLTQKLYSLEIETCDALTSLPEDFKELSYLRNLYIINCSSLKSIQASHLPKALKILYIRKCKEVEFFTAEKHDGLENLCIESSCDSLKSFPLAIFPKLISLSIWDCAKFNSLSIAEEVHEYHKSLDALEIRDCTQFLSFPKGELGIPNLTSMLLSNCKNLKVLPGQQHGLTSLRSLIVNECPEVESVQEGGLPSSLTLVCISFCHKLTPRVEWKLNKLDDFSRIEIEDVGKDLKSFPEEELLPQNLVSLRISRLQNLKVLDYKGLKHLTSLETLKINSCKELHSLPQEGLPSSLSYLYISDCPLLNSELQNRRGKEWFKIAHIPHIQIDGKVIS